MKIAIDIQGIQSQSRTRGIGRYTLSLVKAILANHGSHEIVLVLNGYFVEAVRQIRDDFRSIIPENDIKIWYPSNDISFNQGGIEKKRLAAEVTREFFLLEINPDVILVCSLFEGLSDPVAVTVNKFIHSIPTVVVLYDLIPLIHKDNYLPNIILKDWYFDRIENIKRADFLLSISESSRIEAIEYLNFPENKITNISAAVDENFRPIRLSEEVERSLRLRFGLSRSFLMYTGGLDDRKNVENLIRAYAALSSELRTKHQLAIVCNLGAQKHSFELLCDDLNLRPGEVVFTGYVLEEDLLNLYNLCYCFIFPSWHEGFGLPVLEAMSCGRAVIGSNSTSIKELLELDAARFDPFDVHSISKLITKTLVDDEFRKKLEHYSIQRAKNFSWNLTAAKVIKTLETNFCELTGCRSSYSSASILPDLVSSMASISAMPESEVEFVRMAHALSLTFPNFKTN